MTSNRRHKKEASARLKKKKKVEWKFTKLALGVLNKHRGKPMTVAELVSAMKLPQHERQRGSAALSSSLQKKVVSGPITRIKNFGVYGGYGYVWPVREPPLSEVQQVVLSILGETLTWREYNYVDEQTSRALFNRVDYEDVSHEAVISLWRDGLVDIKHLYQIDVEQMSMSQRQRSIPMMSRCRCRLGINGLLKDRLSQELAPVI